MNIGEKFSRLSADLEIFCQQMVRVRKLKLGKKLQFIKTNKFVFFLLIFCIFETKVGKLESQKSNRVFVFELSWVWNLDTKTVRNRERERGKPYLQMFFLHVSSISA